MKITYGIIGSGGYGREVIPLAREALKGELTSGRADLIFVVEQITDNLIVNGYPVISLRDFLALPGHRYFNIAIGNSLVRERISDLCISADAMPFEIKASNVVVFDGNIIGAGAILSPFFTITSNANIGNFFHGNIYSYVAHDCVIGDFVTFAPGVKCNGNVRIEDHAYIGTGAILKQGTSDNPLVIGKGATVGMGAVVTKNVPANTTVVGNPARILVKGTL